MRRIFPRRAGPVMPHSDSERNFECAPRSGIAWHTDVACDANSHFHPASDSDSDVDFVGNAAPTLDSDSDADAGNESYPDENRYRDATVDASAATVQSEPGRNLGYACLFSGSRTAVGVTGRCISRNSGRPHLGRPATPTASAQPAPGTGQGRAFPQSGQHVPA